MAALPNPPLPPNDKRLSLVQIDVLLRDLNKDRIAVRRQGGRSLSYLEAWDVKAALIKVFGPAGFSAETDQCKIVLIENDVPKTTGSGDNKRILPVERNPDGTVKFGTANFRVTARARCKLTIHQTGAIYTEWAASSQTGPDIGEVTDFAIKTAESDALKRAATYLGTQFGLSLYNDGATQDVVKRVFAPGQEWPRQQTTPNDDAEKLAAAAALVELSAESGLPPEEQAKNVAMINRALGIRAQDDAAETPDTPMALAE